MCYMKTSDRKICHNNNYYYGSNMAKYGEREIFEECCIHDTGTVLKISLYFR